ncbi:MAG: hypothetical protein LPL29_02235 [Alphaproteobacteria bacterium]|nr:hypothetical protein [Alphaproteobacteria bacterium]
MSNTIRIRRRAAGGGAGAPASMKNGELAFNEADLKLYYGFGDSGGGDATSIIVIGGTGAFATLDTNQTFGGEKTFTLPIIGDITGNAATATKLATARTITAGGDLTGNVSFDGSANVTFNLAVNDNSHAHTAANISDLAATVQAYRLDQFAAPTADVDMNGQKLTGLAAPVNTTDAATKQYVDNAVQGINATSSCRVKTTANVTLSGLQTIDGIALSNGERVLVTEQSTPSQNGVYIAGTGAWTRASDADAWDEMIAMFVFIEEGNTYADTSWLCTVDQGGTLDTTAITFVQFGSAAAYLAGNGMTLDGNTFNVGAGTGIAVDTSSVSLAGQALALHQLGVNGFFVRTGAGTVAARSIETSGEGISVGNGDGVSGNPTISLDATLAALSQLTTAADQFIYATGADAFSVATVTAFGRSLLAAASNTAARTVLGLGSMATQNANAVAITGGSIDGVTIDGGTF